MSKINSFSTLYSMHVIEPEYVDINIETMFEETSLETISAVLMHTPDGGMIGSTHLTLYRIH
jgi:hypothetical protein